MTATETEAPPEVEQQASPHDVYGPPTNNNPAGGSNKVDGPNNAPGVVINVAGGANHTPPSNTATVVYPGGSPSEESKVTFTPTLTSITPTTSTTAASPVTVTFTGTKFVQGTQVTVDGVTVPTTYVSATSVTASIATPTVKTYVLNVTNGGLASATPRNLGVAS